MSDGPKPKPVLDTGTRVQVHFFTSYSSAREYRLGIISGYDGMQNVTGGVVTQDQVHWRVDQHVYIVQLENGPEKKVYEERIRLDPRYY